jgi:hypothetical protein
MRKKDAMRLVTKAVLAALAMTGSIMAVSSPAKAQVSAYVGIGDPGYYGPDPYADPYYGDPYYADPYDSAYADPYACDYYDPPWGYPPDYCAYQIWQQPIYVGGIWYSGPVYYRGFGADRMFWLNGGWHRDEWRGARPGRIDWGRNMRWSGPVHHFTGRGGNFAGRAWNGGNFERGVRGRDFGGHNFAPQSGPRQAFRAGGNFNRAAEGGRDFGRRNFAAPQSGQRQAFQGSGSVRGRFGGQSFAGGGHAAGRSFGGQAGPRGGGGFQRGGGGHGGGGQGGGGQGHHGR